MNSNRHFDEYIKEQLGNYTPDVHPRIWKKIIAEKDKKRPVGFWVSMLNNRGKLLLLGLIIALSSGGTWLYYNKVNAAKERLSNVADTKRINDAVDTKNNIPVSEISSGNTINPVELNNNTSAAEDVNANTNLLLSSKANTRSTIFSPSAETDPATDFKNITRKGNKKQYTGLGNVLVNTTTPDAEEDEYAAQGGTLLGRLTFNAEKITEKRKSKKQETLHFNPVIFLPDCPALEKDAAGNKKYFEFYAGPDYAFRSLQDTGNSAYLQKKRKHKV
jgi:hypothetical protein